MKIDLLITYVSIIIKNAKTILMNKIYNLIGVKEQEEGQKQF
jgi:hypothetical protein